MPDIAAPGSLGQSPPLAKVFAAHPVVLHNKTGGQPAATHLNCGLDSIYTVSVT